MEYKITDTGAHIPRPGGIGLVLFNRDTAKWGLFYLGLYLLIYGVFLHGRDWYLNIDEIRDYTVGNNTWELYLSNGRWGLALYRTVFQGLAPLGGVLIAGVWYAAALLLQTHLMGIKSSFCKAMYGAIALSVPLLGHHLLFANQADAVGLGMLLSTLAVWAVGDKRPKILFTGAVCLALALAIYQSLVLNFAVLSMAMFYLQSLRCNTLRLRHHAWACTAVLIPALLLYAGVTYAGKAIIPISEHIQQHTAMYQSALFAPEADMSHTHIILQFAENSLLSPKLLMLMLGVGLPLSFCTGAIAAVLLLPAATGHGITRTQRALRILLPICILATPFLICTCSHLPDNDPALVRTYTAAPWACAALWVAAAEYYRAEVRLLLRRGLVCVTGFLVLYACYDCGKMHKEAQAFYSKFIRDYILIEHEAARLAAEHTGSKQSPRVLLFGGEELSPFDDFSSHPFVTSLHLPTAQERAAHSTTANSMPLWPAAGALRYVGNNTVIVHYR